MKKNVLTPKNPKLWGWVAFATSVALFVSHSILGFNIPINANVWGYVSSPNLIEQSGQLGYAQVELVHTIELILSTLGLLTVLFANTKNENQSTKELRNNSISWALAVNAFMMIGASLAIWDMSFLTVLTLNLPMFALLSVARFSYLKYCMNNSDAYSAKKLDESLISAKWMKLGFMLTGAAFIMHGYDLSIDGMAKLMFDSTNIYQTVNIVIGMIGLLLITFSKSKNESHKSADLRTNSLKYAIIIHYAVLTILALFVWEMNFLRVMIYAMFSPMIINICIYTYTNYKLKINNSINTLNGEAV